MAGKFVGIRLSDSERAYLESAYGSVQAGLRAAIKALMGGPTAAESDIGDLEGRADIKASPPKPRRLKDPAPVARPETPSPVAPEASSRTPAQQAAREHLKDRPRPGKRA
jgi:hypothetical protein